jgi:hypothetical protein
MKAGGWLVLTMMLLSRSAAAGCEKDADCKGDRVCEDSVCVDPRCEKDTDCPGDGICVEGACKGDGRKARPRARSRVRDDDPDDYGTKRLRQARGRAIASLVLAPVGLIGSLGAGVAAAVAVAEDDDNWPLFVLAQLIPFGLEVAAGACGGHGGVIARDGLAQLGREPRGRGLAIAGWVVWGAGLASMIGASLVAAGFNSSIDDENIPPVVTLQVAGAAIATAGGIMLGVDALSSSKAIARELASTDSVRWTILPSLGRGSTGVAFAMAF